MDEYNFYKPITRILTSWWEKMSGKSEKQEPFEEIERRIASRKQAFELKQYSKRWLTYWD